MGGLFDCTSICDDHRVVSRAIILAAGMGTRLDDGRSIPKPLRQVSGVPLIERVLRSLHQGGVKEVGIVIGHLGERIVEALKDVEAPALSFFQNDEYKKPNGTSLLKAREFVVGPTLLLMSDHLFSSSLLSAVMAFPLKNDEAVLGVDRRIDACFDIDDATKVQADGDKIIQIHKELEVYNALDTGVFRITPALITALDEADGPEGCTLSQGVWALAERGKMKVVDVGESIWVDVDTPEAHAHAEKLVAEFGDELQPPASGVVLRSSVERRGMWNARSSYAGFGG